jgi:hypothetical protein
MAPLILLFLCQPRSLPAFQTAIIQQADDANTLLEALDLIERNLYYEDNVNSDLCKVIRRYLTAIEGGSHEQL